MPSRLRSSLFLCAVCTFFVTALGAPHEVLAQSCGAGAQSSLAPDAAGGIPPEMLAILRALRKGKQAFCERVGAGGHELPTAVDPNSVLPPDDLSQLTDGPSIPDEVVVTVTGDGDNITEIASANQLEVRSRRRSGLLDAFIVRFGIPDGRSVRDVVAELAGDVRVERVAPQHVYSLQEDGVEGARFALTKIALDKVESRFTGRAIRIAVIDTAVDSKHPGLDGAVLKTFDALPDTPVVDRSHGTSIAGLIAGRSLIRGVAPESQLLIARAFDKSGGATSQATVSSLVNALDWAIENDARIINMSFGGPRNSVFSRALAAAYDEGAVLIAAAGNDGPEAPAAFPAAEPSVLAVTAIDSRDRIYADANAGSYVFIAAPGVDVLVPTPDEGMDLVQGTSYASAIVSGIAALMLQRQPGMSPVELARGLERAAQDLGEPGRDPTFGFGLANAAETVLQLP
jgi:subtilisin family serine protease